MPTIEDLGKLVKSKYPDSDYAKMSDSEVGKLVKKKFPGSDYEKFADKAPLLSTVAGQRLSRLKTGALAEESSQAATEEKQASLALKGVTVGAEMAPFALAAPFTGGASIPTGLSIMGGAGLASGAVRETLTAMKGEQNKTPGQIAKSLALDTVIGAGTEGGLKGITTLAKLGGPLWERFLLKAAQKTQTGRALVTDMEVQAYQPLEQAVAGRLANVRPAYEAFMDKLAQIPRGRGATGQKLAGPVGGDIGDLAARISKDLKASGPGMTASVGPVEAVSTQAAPMAGSQRLLGEGAKTAIEPSIHDLRPLGAPFPGHIAERDLTKQPLDALIRMHSEANRVAWAAEAERTAAAPARKAAREFARDLNDAIIKRLAPDERELYTAAKKITEEKMKYDLGQKVVRFWFQKGLFGMAGTVLGIEELEKRYGAAMLESWVTNNRAGFQKAVSQVMNGATVEEVGNATWRAIDRAVPAEVMERIKEELTRAPKKEVLNAP